MPPRYAYWTILVGDQPTAFRAGSQEDLMPTFKRLQAKHADAKMLWFQNGKLWPSRIDAQEAMRARGEMGRRSDERQLARRSVGEGGAGFGSRDRDFKPKSRFEKPDWKPRGKAEDAAWPKPQAASPKSSGKLDWKPKGEFIPAPKRSERPDWTPKSQATSARASRSEKPEWKSRTQEARPTTSRSEKPEWKPKGSFDRDRKPDWKPKSQAPGPGSRGDWKPKGAAAERDRKPRSFARPEWKPSGDDTGSAKHEWKPKGSFTRERKPDWKPKGSFDRERKPEWRTKTARPSTFAKAPADRQDRKTSRSAGERKDRSEKLAWSPKSQDPSPKSPEKRKWVPKAEYKKSLGIEAKRDDKWRPGGEHRDPKQKYKDAKKAKWSKFKTNIRQKWEKKAGKKSDK